MLNLLNLCSIARNNRPNTTVLTDGQCHPSRSDLIDSWTARPRRHGDRFCCRTYQTPEARRPEMVRFPKEQSDARSRFEREMLAIGKLNHPSIVSATDAGQEGDLQYLVMELVRGMDLSQIARRIPNMAISDVCEIGRQIAMALSHAHSQGFVHRDIKPSNVMLDEHGCDYRCSILDWCCSINGITRLAN